MPTSNISALVVLHGSNFLLTLSIIPYLTRVLGIEGWGQIVFVQMIVNYLIWIANWSFYLGAAKKIAVNRHDLEKLKIIYSTTLLAQLFLTLLAISVLTILALSLPAFRTNMTLYLLGIGLLIGNLMQPLWFLNGLEKIKESAAIQLVTKLLTMPVIFAFIHDWDDAYIYFVANAVSAMSIGLGYMYWIRRKYQMSFSYVQPTQAMAELRDGLTLFFSNFWANLYGTMIPMAIGIIGGPIQLGYYNIADRIRSACIQIIHPVTHAMYPRMCHLLHNNPSEARNLLRVSGSIIIFGAFIISISIYALSGPIIRVMSGSEHASNEILRIMALSIPVITLSEFLIYQWLIPTGRDSLVNKSKLITLITALLLIYPAINLGGSIGGAWLSLLAEGIMVMVIIFGLIKHQRSLKREPLIKMEF